jgi:hypothetical protein
MIVKIIPPGYDNVYSFANIIKSGIEGVFKKMKDIDIGIFSYNLNA